VFVPSSARTETMDPVKHVTARITVSVCFIEVLILFLCFVGCTGFNT
jgi:hypothetical protein